MLLKGTLYIQEVLNSSSANILLSPASEAGFAWQLISAPFTEALEEEPVPLLQPRCSVGSPQRTLFKQAGTHRTHPRSDN